MRHTTFAAAAATVFTISVTCAFADPPLEPPKDTNCPTVQCMRVGNVVDNLDGSFDVEFETFNWWNTNPDTGVNTVLFFPSNAVLKTTALCDGNSNGYQAEVLGATAPPNWTVVQADNNKVEFQSNATSFEIPDLDLCDSSVIGGCINGGGPGVSTCGNEQGGFIIRLAPDVPTGSVCSWVANWRHLDELGVDNGDVMNFGAVSWTFGSLIEAYSNTPMPPFFFQQTNVETCAAKVQKSAAKYAGTRLKTHSKCIDSINKGKGCDTGKRDLKVGKAQTKLETTIDASCVDDDVANVPWCGTTVASLKSCLVADLDSSTDSAIATVYGPQ